jgi:hypothetical protein
MKLVRASTICTAATGFSNRVSTQPESLTHKQFEVTPIHRPQGCAICVGRHLGHQTLSLATTNSGRCCTSQQ